MARAMQSGTNPAPDGPPTERAAGLQLRLVQAAPIPLDLELACGPGELLALAGPSGAGKTTVLRAIAGLHRPAAGRIVCAGQCWLDTTARIDVPARRRPIGMVFQSYALFPHLSALENLVEAMPRALADRPARAAALLERVNLGGLGHRLPRELSGGQQQRVAVARALAREPSVLLLDEPFSAVDKTTRERLYGELASLRQSLSIPILLVTHDLDEAMLLADRMALLAHGRVLQAGPPAEVLRRPASVEVARLTGLRNRFRARVLGHDAQAGVTRIDWEGLALETGHRPEFAPGAQLVWAIPADGVLLVIPGRPVPAGDTCFNGRVTRIVALGSLLHVTVQPFDRAGLPLTFTVSRHVAERHTIAPGQDLLLRLRGDSIQLMVDETLSQGAVDSLSPKQEA